LQLMQIASREPFGPGRQSTEAWGMTNFRILE
jgi:hypothetical protein